VLQGQLGSAQCGVGRGEVLAGDGQGRVQAHGLLEVWQGVLGTVQPIDRGAHVVVRRWVIGAELQGLAIVAQGQLVLAAGGKG